MARISLIQVAVFLDAFCDRASSSNFGEDLWNLNLLPEPGAQGRRELCGTCSLLVRLGLSNTYARKFP